MIWAGISRFLAGTIKQGFPLLDPPLWNPPGTHDQGIGLPGFGGVTGLACGLNWGQLILPTAEVSP